MRRALRLRWSLVALLGLALAACDDEADSRCESGTDCGSEGEGEGAEGEGEGAEGEGEGAEGEGEGAEGEGEGAEGEGEGAEGEGEGAEGEGEGAEGEGEGAEGEGEAPTPTTWCALLAEASCAARRDCPTPGQDPPATAPCEEEARRRCGAELLPALVDREWVAFDAAAAARCLTAWTSLDCEAFQRHFGEGQDPACLAVLAGRQATGADCVSGAECGPHSFCSFDQQCPGSCVAFGQPGDGCDLWNWCEPGLALCQEGRCVAAPDQAGASCPAGQCAGGLRCAVAADPAASVCVGGGLVGEDCGAPGDPLCAGSLVCLQPVPGLGGSCALPGGPDAPCFDASQCRSDDPQQTLVCQGGHCTVAPGPGSPCLDLQCDRSFCDPMQLPPTCVAFAEADAPCPAGSRCAEGLWCDPTAGPSCRPLRDAGQACADSLSCAAGTSCLLGRCLREGEPPCALP